MRTVTFIIAIALIFSAKIYSQDFEVSPIRLYFNSKPGEIQVKTISITNHAQNKAIFSLKLNDFIVNNEGERNFLAKGTSTNSLNDWLEVSQNTVELNPNESAEVVLRLHAPQDDFSSKWGMLIIEAVKEQSPFSADTRMQTGMNLSAQVAVVIFQSAPQNNDVDIKINNLADITKTTDTKRIFSAVIENKGSQIVPCKVLLIAANMQTAEEFVFEPQYIDVYPNSTRIIRLQLPNTIPPGKYSISAILDYGSQSNLEGTQTTITVE